jgi:hypothetical protein
LKAHTSFLLIMSTKAALAFSVTAAAALAFVIAAGLITALLLCGRKKQRQIVDILANPKMQQVTKGMTIALQETQDKRSSALTVRQKR